MSIKTAQTAFGTVSGVLEEGVMLFKGVPYAAPPVGALRWKPPVDPEPWEGVRACDRFAARPMQPEGTGLSVEPWASDFYYMGNPPAADLRADTAMRSSLTRKSLPKKAWSS